MNRSWLVVKVVAVVVGIPVFFLRFGGFPQGRQVTLWLVAVGALTAIAFYSLERAKEGLSETWLNEPGKSWRRLGIMLSWNPYEYDDASRSWFWITWIFWAASIMLWFWGSEHFGGRIRSL